MIESIHIKNFRGIQDGKIDRFSKINLLVGPNNSGKSAVLETIYMANTASQEAILEIYGVSYKVTTPAKDNLGFDPLGKICERHNKKVESGRGESVSIRSSVEPTFGARLHIPLVPEEETKVALFLITGQTLILKEAEMTTHGNMAAPESFNKLFDRLLDNMSDGGLGRSLIYFWERGLTYFQEKEAAWDVAGIKPSAQNTLFYDASITFEHIPFEYFRQMLAVVPGWTHKIAKSFERIFQLKQKFNVTFLQLQHDLSQTQGFIAPEDEVALTIDDYGDGARSAFKMLTPLIALSELATEDEPGVFIWEEPELFQNPQSLGKLLAEVVGLIKDKPIQLFIATHSIEVVAQFVGLVNEQAISAEDLLAIRLNLQDGQLSSSAFNHQDIQDWTAMHLDLRVPDGRVDSPLKFQLAEASNDGE